MSHQIKHVRTSKKGKRFRAGRKPTVEIHIPTHWGNAKIVAWEVHGDTGMVDSFKTRKEACIMFPYLKKTQSFTPPTKICPLVKYERAVMNPYAVVWDKCFVPTKEDMKIPGKMTWAVKGFIQGKGDRVVGHLQSREIDPFKLRKLANKKPAIIAKADKLGIMKSDSPKLKYWFSFELEKYE